LQEFLPQLRLQGRQLLGICRERDGRRTPGRVIRNF
jgi:hypothetical protein